MANDEDKPIPAEPSAPQNLGPGGGLAPDERPIPAEPMQYVQEGLTPSEEMRPVIGSEGPPVPPERGRDAPEG